MGCLKISAEHISPEQTRCVFDRQTCCCSAAIKFSGIPQRPKPPRRATAEVVENEFFWIQKGLWLEACGKHVWKLKVKLNPIGIAKKQGAIHLITFVNMNCFVFWEISDAYHCFIPNQLKSLCTYVEACDPKRKPTSNDIINLAELQKKQIGVSISVYMHGWSFLGLRKTTTSSWRKRVFLSQGKKQNPFTSKRQNQGPFALWDSKWPIQSVEPSGTSLMASCADATTCNCWGRGAHSATNEREIAVEVGCRMALCLTNPRAPNTQIPSKKVFNPLETPQLRNFLEGIWSPRGCLINDLRSFFLSNDYDYGNLEVGWLMTAMVDYYCYYYCYCYYHNNYYYTNDFQSIFSVPTYSESIYF